ncbi:MAG: PstS family phosphate ABC transporter substrate-binding protein [Pseudomonadota bacterium]|nr:PstS family phosphate ABC transporter substrate-binding protein [Pseudomonadota bacterium]
MLVSLLLLACSGSETASEPTGSGPPAAPATPAPAPASGTIQVKGSDSEVNLVQRLAEEFMKKNPSASIAVTGGGSGAGIAAIIDGTTTIANSSREMKGAEKIEASRNNVDIKSFVFATDGLAVIVNANNPMDTIDLEKLGGIYRGELATWDAVGAGTGPVSLYGRQSNSGTYDYFKSAAVKGEYATSLKQMNGTAQIVEGVKADPGGIGYVAAGYVAGENGKGIKVLSVTGAGGAPVSPLDEAAVLSGAYPLARPLYQFINGAPNGPLREFLAYEASPEGQALVKEMGFYPIGTEYVATNQALVAGN